MFVSQFKSSVTPALDVEIKEVVDARGNYASLKKRLDYLESIISRILNM